MKDFFVLKYYDTCAFLAEEPILDPFRFTGVPYIPVEEIMLEKQYSGKKAMIPCPEGWRSLEWRIAYEAVFQLCSHDLFETSYEASGELCIHIHEIRGNIWEAYRELYPEDTVIIPRYKLLRCIEDSTTGVDLRMCEYKYQTKDFLFDQRKAIEECYRNNGSEETIKELRRVKKDLELAIQIAGLSDDIEDIYKQVKKVLERYEI